MITLITPTGGRPQTFALCEKWMHAQKSYTEHPAQWIVIDDCYPPTETNMRQEVIRPDRPWQPGDNTQARNLLMALPYIKGDRIAIIEDDDYYAPKYLERMLQALQTSAVVGEIPSYYYNLKERRWRDNTNWNNASLCQTAFRREMLPMFKEACESGEKFIDLRFWAAAKASGKGSFIKEQMPLCVGMKGLPGREGIGYGHKANPNWQRDDERFSMLYHFCGADAETYIEIARGL